MNPGHYDMAVQNRADHVRDRAEELEEEYSDRDNLTEEDYLIEATILEVNPSEQCSPVEQAEIYFECSEYTETDIPMNWRDFPNNPTDPLKENLEVVVDGVMRLDVLDRVGVDMSRQALLDHDFFPVALIG